MPLWSRREGDGQNRATLPPLTKQENFVRVIVCGGRTYGNRWRLTDELNAIHAATPITALIHGNAHGADALADEWAAGKVKTLTFTPL